MKYTRNNVNDNEVSRIETNNVNDNVGFATKKTNAQIDLIAHRIQLILNDNGDSWRFYCKVARKLSESMIQDNLDVAVRQGNNPRKYFSWLCNQSMKGRHLGGYRAGGAPHNSHTTILAESRA